MGQGRSGANKPPAVAQALVNWASVDSVALYGQMQPQQLAAHVNDAVAVDAGRHADLPMPHMDADTVAEELEACCAYLDATSLAKRTAPANDTTSANPPTTPAPPQARKRLRLDAATPAPPTTMPTPACGTRVQIYWTDEDRWFSGTLGRTRRADGATRVMYDAVDAWPAQPAYHVLATETWRLA